MSDARTRLKDRTYPHDWTAVRHVYLDVVDVVIKSRKPGYDPAKEAAAARRIWDAIGTRIPEPADRLPVLIGVIAKCCRDYDRSIKQPAAQVSADDAVWPFARADFPVLKKLDTFWEDAWAIWSRTQVEESRRALAEQGRRRYAADAEKARAEDAEKAAGFAVLEAAEKQTEQQVLAERIRRWAERNPDESAILAAKATLYVRTLFPALDVNAAGETGQVAKKIEQKKGFAYTFWLEAMEAAALFPPGDPRHRAIPTPSELRRRVLGLKYSADQLAQEISKESTNGA